MTMRGLSSDEETMIFYRMNDNSIELQKTTWGKTENIIINDENDTCVTLTIGCVFTIRPTIIVLNKNSTKCTIIKTCDIQLKIVGVNNNKLIEMPDQIRQLNFMHTKEPYTAKINKYNSPTITTINKTITTEEITDNITIYADNSDHLDTTINKIKNDNETEHLINNTTDTPPLLNSESNKSKVQYYNFVISVVLSTLIVTIMLVTIDVLYNFKCVNRHRYKYIGNLIQEQSIELNVNKVIYIKKKYIYI